MAQANAVSHETDGNAAAPARRKRTPAEIVSQLQARDPSLRSGRRRRRRESGAGLVTCNTCSPTRTPPGPWRWSG
jgi:hypothetical protein